MQPNRHAPLISYASFAVLAAGAGFASGSLAIVVYALGFWHYALYWLAYRHGAVALPDFKRDAVAFKTVALLALGAAYFTAPLDALSIVVVASGFALNAAAARVLGTDRTYYGHEVAGLAPLRITAFPYSWISHPMLAGNIAAYAGTIINAGFRREWWPLACAHVALNLGLLVMEVTVTPRRGRAESSVPAPRVRLWLQVAVFVGTGAAIGAAAGAWGPWGGQALTGLGLVLGAGAGAHMAVMYLCYTSSLSPRNGRQTMENPQ